MYLQYGNQTDAKYLYTITFQKKSFSALRILNIQVKSTKATLESALRCRISVLWQKAFLTFGKFPVAITTFSTSGLSAVLANRNPAVVAFLTSAFSTFSGRSLHTRLFYGIFLGYFLCNTGSSQAFNQLQNKLESGNFSTGSFLVNNPSV